MILKYNSRDLEVIVGLAKTVKWAKKARKNLWIYSSNRMKKNLLLCWWKLSKYVAKRPLLTFRLHLSTPPTICLQLSTLVTCILSQERPDSAFTWLQVSSNVSKEAIKASYILIYTTIKLRLWMLLAGIHSQYLFLKKQLFLKKKTVF